MNSKKCFVVFLLLLTSHALWAWRGNGTPTDPYLIQKSGDWEDLVSGSNGGNSYAGKVFRMTSDIDTGGRSVGENPSVPFSGTFDGDGYTLTYNIGSATQAAKQQCAPFVYVSGATIRHLRVRGTIYTNQQYAGGVVSMVYGPGATMIDDCKSAVRIVGHEVTNAAHGGLVGAVATGTLTIDHCVYSGHFSSNNSGGMVGWSNTDLTIRHSLVDTSEHIFSSGSRTFARMAGGATMTLTDSYFTHEVSANYEAPQGEAVFKEIEMPAGCSYTIAEQPTISIDGTGYWKSGTWVTLTAPADAAFHHWATGRWGCFVSDPFTRDGLHRIADLHGTPHIEIATSMPAGEERTMDGTRYRYLTTDDYHLYISDDDCAAHGWQLKDGYLKKYVQAKDSWAYIMAVVGWVEGKIPSDGLQIHNDLAGDWYDHTLTGLIAPRAFEGCQELKTLYFKDTDANNKNALQGFDFIIGQRAFASCPNLTEMKMMQYTTEGNNHWEALRPEQVTYADPTAFDGSPSARISCHRDVYQQYLSSKTWKPFASRITVYDATVEDFTVDGVKYHQYRDKTETRLLTNNNLQEMMDNHVRIWNADYKDFNAASLLDVSDGSQNVYYTSVVGVDNSYLDAHSGKMVILNDLGTYYNYKTICLGRGALAGSKSLRSIEFRQVNGDQTSRSDLRMVIQNGALAHCDSLKEIRMYYWCEDGDDHWETLGPENVIPGDNIFGLPSDEELDHMSDAEQMARATIPDDFRILVSPTRYQEFLMDPNWKPYAHRIVPADYELTSWKEQEVDGLTYDYSARTVGVAGTNQVVTQNLSWWNLPIKVYEAITVYKMLVSMGEIIYDMREAWELFQALKEQKAALERVVNARVTDLELIRGVEKVDEETIRTVIERGFNNLGNRHAESAKALRAWGLINNQYAYTRDAYNIIVHRQEVRSLLVRNMRDYVDFMFNGMHPQHTMLVNNASAEYLKGLAELYTDLSAATAYIPSIMRWSYAGYQATHGTVSEEQYQRGLVENIKANIHNAAYENTLIYTPDKKLVYHVYVKKPAKEQDSITIYNDIGSAWNYRTVAIAKDAFQQNKTLRRVGFAEAYSSGAVSYVPMQLTIPDSAFAGCQNLERLYMTYKTKNGGYRSLGPENFILCGDSIFAGCDPARFRIVIAKERRQDFLDDEMWKKYERYFTYTDLPDVQAHSDFGVNYAYLYDNNTTQRISKVTGHKIEHLVAISANSEFLNGHQGSMGLFNDIGTYNNYKLDEVKPRAFRGNQSLRSVAFYDLNGGDAYTTLGLTLGDSCFADCRNLVNIDMLYCVTDGTDHIDLLKPSQVQAGVGMFDGTQARIKMMPQQVSWFQADSAWARYRDRFLPCIIQPADEGVKAALKDMCYYTPCSSPYRWPDYIDLMRIAGAGFSWLDGRFTAQKNNIMSFADFKYFEGVGLDYVGKGWFRDCGLMSSILLPATIQRIEESAFEGCGKLQEMELPAAVRSIDSRAFAGCGLLTTIVVKGAEPATLGADAFTRNDGLRIYVPQASVQAYKQAWSQYADYIVGDDALNRNYKVVTLSKAGTLAEKLGLYVEWSYTGVIAGDEPRYLHGNYAKYDSLTVSGPLNDLDLAVIRYLAGADSYTKNGGRTTDGQLRYLDISNTTIVKDSECKAHYANLGGTFSTGWQDIRQDNQLPSYLFINCKRLEEVVLPSTISKIGTGMFVNCDGLRRVAITGNVQTYDEVGVMEKMLTHPIDELVFVTGTVAKTECSDSWGQDIGSIYTKKSQLGDYVGQVNLARHARNMLAPFADDAVVETLASKGLYFPGDYLTRDNVEGLFTNNSTIKHFDDFNVFVGVERLDRTFYGATALESVTLPLNVSHIGSEAFAACESLRSIHVACDSVPKMEQGALAALPDDFVIYVPKELCKLYRTKWAEYADHINPEVYDSDIRTVVVTEPNTLAEKLGLKVTVDHHTMKSQGHDVPFITALSGDYTALTHLKVIGPISTGDLSVLRYLAGYTPWDDCRNYVGHLEYIDLYDAHLKYTTWDCAPDKYYHLLNPETGIMSFNVDDELPPYAFLKAYALKTLILPKTCKVVRSRAMQECENLETLVIGDDMEDFNWNALDDGASLTRLYILAKKKPTISADFAPWRWLCNNYNPTFDAFYVRPSLYQDYVGDTNYTGSSWQRTNNVSKGVFSDDESFCAFAAHAAATVDDLRGITSVDGWFDQRQEARDLTALRFTAIDTLSADALGPLSKLERIALPKTVKSIEPNVFKHCKSLRYADLLMCDSTMVARQLRDGGLQTVGIDTERTLVYLPQQYGETDETNVIVRNGTVLKTKTFRLVDSLDYVVPYAFDAEAVENTRVLTKNTVPYTVCLPYAIDVPPYSRAYRLNSRDGSTLTFTELEEGEKLEALQPYLVKVVGNKRFNKNRTTLNTSMAQTIPANSGSTYGQQTDVAGYSMRGTLEAIDNATAADMGAYILQGDGNWHPVSATDDEQRKAYILPYRAFLLPSARNAAARISMTLEDLDDIDTIETIDRNGTGQLYDLQGREVSTAHKGIVISKGQKFINK